MDDKELNEILNKYAESEKGNMEVAFAKLNAKPKEERRARKRMKPRYIFATAMMCAIVLVLCITLPITLTGNSDPDSSNFTPQPVEPTYFDEIDLDYTVEDSLSFLKNAYGIDAKFPNREAETIKSISSSKDSEMKGALLDYLICEDYEVDIRLHIIPKMYIINIFESYFTLMNEVSWGEYTVKYSKVVDDKSDETEMKAYFTDGKYDYFITADIDSDIGASELLDILYA